MIKIDSGIPLTPRKVAPGSAQKYPFSKMAIGDSFECEPGKHHSVKNCATRWCRNTGSAFRFSVRVGPNGPHRCWRVA